MDRDTKYDTIIQLLERYSNIDLDIREFKDSLSLLEEIHNDNIGADITSPLQQAVIQTSNISDKTAAAAINYINQIEQIKRKINNAIYFKLYVYNIYSTLNRFHKLIFKKVYMSEYRNSNRIISSELHCSTITLKRHLKQIHNTYYNSNIIDYLELI